MFGITLVKEASVAKLKREVARLSTESSLALNLVDMIEKRNWDACSPIMQSNKDSIVSKLVALKKSLFELSKQEQERLWISEGLTKFGFLFEHSKDIDNIFDKTLCELVRYIGANQGAIYLLNEIDEANPCLELQATYAYGKKKFVTRRVALDYGLIGQAYMEGSFVYLNEIPKDYLKITSGLGEATPRCIIIVPLVSQTNKMGVLELAFFRPITNCQTEFLEKLSSKIADSMFLIQSAKRNERFLKLSEETTAQLRKKEEDLLIHLEELNVAKLKLEYNNVALNNAKMEIEAQKDELEKVKQREFELIESKLRTQKSIHDLTIRKLMEKIAELEERIQVADFKISINQ